MLKSKRQQVHERIARVARGGVPRDRPVAARAAGPPLLGGGAGRSRPSTTGREAGLRLAGPVGPRRGDRPRHPRARAGPLAARVARPRRDRAGLPGPASRSRSWPPGATPSPDLEAVHARARELAERIGDSATALPRHLGDVGPPPPPRRDGHGDRPRRSVPRAGPSREPTRGRPSRPGSRSRSPGSTGASSGRSSKPAAIARSWRTRSLPGQRPRHRPGHRDELPLLPGPGLLASRRARRRLARDQRGGRIHPRGRTIRSAWPMSCITPAGRPTSSAAGATTASASATSA